MDGFASLEGGEAAPQSPRVMGRYELLGKLGIAIAGESDEHFEQV